MDADEVLRLKQIKGLEDAFNRWRDGEFSDDEVSGFTGLTPRALRDLAKWGAIETAGGEKGRGKRRAWKRTAICKAAMTAAFHKAGLSLPMAARIAFYVWNISPNSSYDPMLRFPKWGELDAPILDTAARRPGEHAEKKWLTDDFATPRHDDDFDSYVHIVNGSFVIAEAAVVPSYRKMREDQYSDEISLDFLQYHQLEPEANTEKAANAFFHFAVKTSVNVTLAMRMAMRRAMNLPVREL